MRRLRRCLCLLFRRCLIVECRALPAQSVATSAAMICRRARIFLRSILLHGRPLRPSLRRQHRGGAATERCYRMRKVRAESEEAFSSAERAGEADSDLVFAGAPIGRCAQ